MELLAAQLGKVPDYVPARMALAGIETLRGRHDEAIAELDKVIKMDPLNYAAQMTTVNVLLAKKEVEKATSLLKRLDGAFANGILVERQRIKLALAQALSQQGDPTGASALLKEVIALQRENAKRIAQAIAEQNPKDPQAAEAAEVAKSAESEESQAAILSLAEINLSPGLPGGAEGVAEAQRSLEAILENRPGLYLAEVLLARAYQMRGRMDEASNIFKEQIKRDAENPVPHFMLGVNLRAQGRVDDAILAFEEAQRLAPADQNTTFQLIALDLQKGDFTVAIDVLKRNWIGSRGRKTGGLTT